MISRIAVCYLFGRRSWNEWRQRPGNPRRASFPTRGAYTKRQTWANCWWCSPQETSRDPRGQSRTRITHNLSLDRFQNSKSLRSLGRYIASLPVQSPSSLTGPAPNAPRVGEMGGPRRIFLPQFRVDSWCGAGKANSLGAGGSHRSFGAATNRWLESHVVYIVVVVLRSAAATNTTGEGAKIPGLLPWCLVLTTS